MITSILSETFYIALHDEASANLMFTTKKRLLLFVSKRFIVNYQVYTILRIDL